MANSFQYQTGGLVGRLSSPASIYVGSAGASMPSLASAKGTVTEFSGLPFDLAIGEVYGLRVWRVDKYGRLRARHVDSAKPWRPGVNVAECNDQAANFSMDRVIDPTGKGRLAVSATVDQGFISREYRITWSDGTSGVYSDLKFEKAPGHEVPNESCRCGFYAYTEPDHIELQMDRGERMVMGVAKGSGRTLLGSQGYRSEKAEIVALLNPAGIGEGTASSKGKELAAQVARVYPDIPLLPTRKALLDFAPVESMLPDPSTDEFWDLP